MAPHCDCRYPTGDPRLPSDQAATAAFKVTETQSELVVASPADVALSSEGLVDLLAPESAQAHAAFKRIDKDGNGVISRIELIHGLT